MFQTAVVCIMLLTAGVLAVRYMDDAGRGSAMATTSAAPSSGTVGQNSRSIMIARDTSGHFLTDARVDGVRLPFVVDTGATHIALRQSDAARLGIRPSSRDYTAKVRTANGTVSAAVVEINRVEIGSITVNDVTGLVLPDEALGANLLGMGFLSRVRWTYERGRLLIEQ
jgi:aspartyl protease family protein